MRTIQYKAVALMVTRTCPLQCRHCISDSSPAVADRMTRDQALQYVDVIPRFAPRLCLTGGEPMLCADVCAQVARRGRELGLKIAMVTGAGWASSDALAARRMESMAEAGLATLEVSWDPYHEEWLSNEYPRRVARAAIAAGIVVGIRVTLPPFVKSDKYQSTFEGLPVLFSGVSLVRLGEAKTLDDDHFDWMDVVPRQSCPMVINPVIEPTGEVFACCGPGRHSKPGSPLRLGNAEVEHLDVILERGRNDPILYVIGLLGPAGLAYFLQDTEEGARIPRRARYNTICDLCLDLTDDPSLVAALRNRLRDFDAQVLIEQAARLIASQGNFRPDLPARLAPGVADSSASSL